jgi:hypothetical protein
MPPSPLGKVFDFFLFDYVRKQYGGDSEAKEMIDLYIKECRTLLRNNTDPHCSRKISKDALEQLIDKAEKLLK